MIRSRAPRPLVATAWFDTRIMVRGAALSAGLAGSATPTRQPAPFGPAPKQRMSPPISIIMPCRFGAAARAAARAWSIT